MNEDELRLVIERTALVRDTAGSAGWELLRDRAAADIGNRQERVLGGRLSELGEYKAMTAWIEGALFVLGLPDRMERELQQARDRLTGDEAA